MKEVISNDPSSATAAKASDGAQSDCPNNPNDESQNGAAVHWSAWLGDGASSIIFSQSATPEQELQGAVLALETELSIARSENPEHRLAVNIWCGPDEAFFDGNIPVRFVGRTRRRVHVLQSPVINEQCQAMSIEGQKSQNTVRNERLLANP